MADTVNGVLEMTAAHVLGQDTLIVSGDGIHNSENDVADEDLLQQALDEASGDLVATSLTPEDESVAVNIADTVADGTFNTSHGVAGEVTFDNVTYSVVTESDNVTYAATSGATLEPSDSLSEDGPLHTSISTIEEGEDDGELGDTVTTSSGVSVRLVPVNQASGAPLGSSQNPIRIIQQGNQYTPVQHLTTEQLQQIMQVVQEQQVAKSTAQEGSSILYNPQTNTRIVYRVIYPSELHKSGGSGTPITLQSQGQQTVVLSQSSRRPYKKRKLEEDPDKQQDGPDLSKEEKELRKKHRPRTRSGRISKPPKHMVKDYKHIHVLDWDEDYDDSDGGYSDFKYSEDEREEREGSESIGIETGVGHPRPKNWKCETCHKSYIGRGGLGRHYRLNPEHGSVDDLPEETLHSFARVSHNGLSNSTGNLSEDSNTQDSISGIPSTGTPNKMFHQRGGYRGRNFENPLKRKNKLRDLIRQCEDEELMEVVLPRLAQVITLWEFLLMKVEKGKPSLPHVDDIYHEFEALSKQVQKFCKTYLKPLANTENNISNVKKLKVENKGMAEVLNLELNTYEVKEIPASELSTFHYRQISSDPARVDISLKPRVKRVEYVTQRQLLSKMAAGKQLTRTTLGGSGGNNFVFTTGRPVVMEASNGKMSSSSTTALLDNQKFGKIDSIVQSVTPVSSTQPRFVTVSAAPSHGGTVLTSSNTNSLAQGVGKQSSSMPVVIQTVESKPGIKPSVVGGISLLPPNLASLANAQKASTSQPVTVSMTSNLVQSSTPTNTIVIQSLPNQSPSNTVVENLLEASSMDRSANDNQQNSVTSLTGPLTSVPMSVVHGLVIEESAIQLSSLSPVTNGEKNMDISVVVEEEEEEQDNSPQEELQKSLDTDTILCKNEVESLDNIMDTSDTIVEATGEFQEAEMVQLVQDQILEEEGVEGIQVPSDHIITASNIYQTADGIIIIQNQDGSTVQLQGGDGEPIPLETVQALLAMDGQLLQTTLEEGEQLQLDQ
ncbi:uncharacterized protein LOC110459172 [Mizuhopecten yessoensis]|uniref:Zinc finger protein 839 n=1 Tax=Mizuhopecten yessoensis TaxID=6573 RepID=A0A210Q516_MIZYE|nr:uncharacterized protein LOC110459172 [Mizuhopecten yessoensis]OWF43836.1 Zinc finger protein 839 [Mizuhopecten yessoensis]